MSGRRSYDAVVVGARAAGSPLAARLAEAGRSVLLVDREPPPADTLSTHVLFPNTLARLHQLGALQRIEAEHTLNPSIYAAHILGIDFEGGFTPVGGFDYMCGITRPVLDKALLDVAVAAGAETRFGEPVTGLLGAGSEEDPARGVVLENGEEIAARWVIGADGRASTVARALGLEKRDPLAGEMAFMFGYWRGLPPSDRFEIGVVERTSLSTSPCEDDISILILGCEPELTHGDAAQRQRNFLQALEQFEWLDLEALRRAEQIAPIRTPRRRCCAASSATATAPAGPWSATPATSSTPPPRRGSPTRSSSRSTSPTNSSRPTASRAMRRGGSSAPASTTSGPSTSVASRPR
jgi:2-polyprenyl-6-methoxyphenol hydroxylase-like FAD-dependent oxidoreductase